MSVSLGLTMCILLDKVVFLSIHGMKVAGIAPFNHLKCINWCWILIAVRIASDTLLYKLQNTTEKVVFRTNASNQNSQKGLSYGVSLNVIKSLVMWNFV